MTDLVSGESSSVGLGFGHTATLARSPSDALVVIRGPDGAAAVEIRVTSGGAVVKGKAASQARDEAAGDVPRLSLRQYASLRAECVGNPERAGAVRAHYGLSEAGDASETATWNRMFGTDAILFDLYKRLFQQFRSTTDAPPPPHGAGDRTLTLEQHATFAAELFASTDREAVYRKYGLEDEVLRGDVLRRCEARLTDGTRLETWKRVYALELTRLQSSRR
ncbi:MAG TPA: hypothetical protein VGG39_10980 [Polyangiaceae bacterium]|jgi:hypothetical protein